MHGDEGAVVAVEIRVIDFHIYEQKKREKAKEIWSVAQKELIGFPFPGYSRLN